ncbi:MAG TPA: hypothetical protein VF546_02035 [Pyrinomonadaceae bacterium]|jgi:hypothetical protein
MFAAYDMKAIEATVSGLLDALLSLKFLGASAGIMHVLGIASHALSKQLNPEVRVETLRPVQEREEQGYVSVRRSRELPRTAHPRQR